MRGFSLLNASLAALNQPLMVFVCVICNGSVLCVCVRGYFASKRFDPVS
jgi:hypothetical protein